MSADGIFFVNLTTLTGILTLALVMYTKFVIKPLLKRYG